MRAPDRSRTDDRLITNQVLYQLSYRGDTFTSGQILFYFCTTVKQWMNIFEGFDLN